MGPCFVSGFGKPWCCSGFDRIPNSGPMLGGHKIHFGHHRPGGRRRQHHYTDRGRLMWGRCIRSSRDSIGFCRVV